MNKILLSGFAGKDAEVTTFDWGEVMRLHHGNYREL